ncbi:MAG TPA: FAD-dependent oxidoreductase, partial [Alphaproteobacteria bacterium]|nr:FAD-dependent oxidoreductase [Alphaproteobacteria bacterium]
MVLMSNAPDSIFVILGCGHAGAQAAATLRAEGFSGRVILIGAEPWHPYERPPLSKAVLAGAAAPEKIEFRKREFYADKAIELRLGVRVARIDRSGRKAIFENGSEQPYDKLLIATGSRLRRLPVPGADLPGVFYLQTLDDSLGIAKGLKPGARIAIVGGGYIGLEVAASAAKAGAKATVLEALDRTLARVASEPMSRFFEAQHRAHGVDVRTGAKVTGIEGSGRVEAVTLASGERIPADLVVIGIGSQAEDALARDAGLACDNGIVVDCCGRTSDPDIFAAGDVTFHHDPKSDTHRRLECVQNAIGQAQAAARAMMGNDRPHAEIPTFWSDQY